MVLKPGVKLTYVTPPMLNIMRAVFDVWNWPGISPVITSAFDGKHMKGSYHYSGLALDFRTRYLGPEDQKDFAVRLQTRLGKKYDVVLEKLHLHIEHDPK